jgi:hypothetical protein
MDWQGVVQGCADVVALTEARVTADRQQAATEIPDVGAQRRLLSLGQAIGGTSASTTAE